MSTVNVDSLLIQRSLVLGENSAGYHRGRIAIPNVPTQGEDSIVSITINTAGTNFTSIPTMSFSGGGGAGAAASAVMKALTAAVATAQSGAGSYVPNDTITFTGGTGTNAVATVQTTQVVSATIAAAGSGGTNGTQTVTGTTGTGTKFQASVTVSGGAITAVLSITVVGNYTANPTTITAEPVTGAGLTGAELNVVMGVLTANITTAGSYSVLPTSPVAQGATSGAGTGATFTLTYGVLSATVTNGGHDYATAPAVAFNGGGGSGAAATAVLATVNDPITVTLEFETPLPTSTYTVAATPDQAAVPSYANYSVNSVDITLTPLNGGTLTTGTMDVVISFTN